MKNLNLKLFVIFLALLLSLILITEVSAQARRGRTPAKTAPAPNDVSSLNKKEGSLGTVGLRGGYFFPVGKLGDSLSGGFAVGLYLDVKPYVFLGSSGAENKKTPLVYTLRAGYDKLFRLEWYRYQLKPTWY